MKLSASPYAHFFVPTASFSHLKYYKIWRKLNHSASSI